MDHPTRRGVLGGLMGLAMTGAAVAGPPRAANWAVPVPLAGAPNLHRITPRLYRAAQPTALGFQNMAAMGIKTVISLRQTVDDTPLAAGTGLVLHRIPMKSRNVGEDGGATIIRVMRLLQAAMADGPVLFHCRHGADRTGAVCALYRMVVDDWTHAAAGDELVNGGYGFHAVWANIPRFVADVDVGAVREAVEG
jgi:protein tyrosine/serine phosphatase